MVQTESNTTLTLEALGSSGAVLSTEMKAALTHSIPIKKAQTGLRSISLWGRISALNGSDYIIAEGLEQAHVLEGRVVRSVHYFFTQDGIKWADLVPVTPSAASVAANLRTMLNGDTATKSFWPPKPEEEEESEEGDSKAKVEYASVTEMERLRVMVDEITACTDLAPVGSQAINAGGDIVANPLFSGLEFPDKLESYFYRHSGPKGSTAAESVRGSWTLRYDKFKDVVVCRNLLYIGYSFFYNRSQNTWGGFYTGDGLKNVDLIFCL